MLPPFSGLTQIERCLGASGNCGHSQGTVGEGKVIGGKILNLNRAQTHIQIMQEYINIDERQKNIHTLSIPGEDNIFFPKGHTDFGKVIEGTQIGLFCCVGTDTTVC